MNINKRLGIEVRLSSIHGQGVFATHKLRRGRSLGLYEGKRYDPGAVRKRNWDESLTYVFGLSDGSVIDGSQGGNALRHLNHSCDPNCAAYEVEDEQGTPVIEIETLRSIEPGEELLLDYRLDVGTRVADDFLCECGAEVCRGTMTA